MVIAEQFGTLASRFPGRIDLGLGRAPGSDPATLRALRRSPGAADSFPEDVLELMGWFRPVEPDQTVRAVLSDALLHRRRRARGPHARPPYLPRMLAEPARPLRRAGLSLLGILLLAIAAFAVVPALRTPRHDRVWAPDNERLAAVHRTGSQVTISNVRDARYRATYLLPSSFDRLLLARRLVETELDLEAARARFRTNARAGDGADTLPDFSARIRRAS